MTRLIFLNLLAGIAYTLTGWVSLWAAFSPDYIAIFFAAAGIGLGAVLVGGYGLLPSVAIGSLGVQWLAHGPSDATEFLATFWVIPTGAAMMAAATAWAIRRWCGYPSTLDRPREATLAFMVIIPVFTLINASLSVPSLVTAGLIHASDGLMSWVTWWLGDTLGAIVITPLMLVLFGQPANAWRPRWKTVALPMLIALSMVVGMLVVLNNKQHNQMLESFASNSNALASQLQRRLDAHTDSVQAISTVMEQAQHSSQGLFSRTARFWLGRYPTDGHNFAWSPVVPHSERAAFESRQLGLPISTVDVAGDTVPAPEAERYFPVLWIAPVAGNEAVIGLDVFTLPATAAAVHRALETLEPAVTAPIPLKQEDGERRMVVMYNGVFKQGVLVGVLSSTLQMDDLLRTVMMNGKVEGMTVCLSDTGAPIGSKTLAGPSGCGEWSASTPSATSRLVQEHTLQFGHRNWLLTVAEAPGVHNSSAKAGLWMTSATGLIATAMLGTFLIIVTGHGRRTIELVDERTQELALSNATLAQMAHYDALTGLANRPYWTEQAELTLQTCEQSQQQVGVIFLDVDRFKHINDSLGHTQGDHLLVTIGSRIQECLRSQDVLARLGGDEFVLLLPGLKGHEGAGAVATKIARILAAPIQLDQMQVRVTASLGVAMFPEHGRTVDELLRHADTAMYAAKAAGRNQWRLFTPEMHEHVSKRLKLETRLRQALEPGQHELHVVYQPQIEAASGRVNGLEALLRWQHPELGPISPVEFIPIAEDCGLIEPLGLWVLHEVCRQIDAWNSGPDADLFAEMSVSMNVTAYEFSRPHFLDQLRKTVWAMTTARHGLELEITESLLVNSNTDTQERMQAIDAMGVRLSLDDFGTGYSSLGYLKRMPLTKLKIDRSFLHGIPGDPENEAIVRATLSMAHDLDLMVVAEGVETEGQRAFLTALGCQSLQGWLFARAMPPDELVVWLRQQHQAMSG